MQNGSGLNPGSFSYGLTGWCNSNTSGQPYPASSLLLPNPADSMKFLLIHTTGDANQAFGMPTNLLVTKIDISLNGGLGAVTQKNQVILQDGISPGIVACKHANGRDWWLVVPKDSSDKVYALLLTPQGVVSTSLQPSGLSLMLNYNGAPVFSPDGTKYALHHRLFGTGPGGSPVQHLIRLFDFDRCTGVFSNPQEFIFVDSISGNGLAFSSDSKYLYWSTWKKIFQLNTDTTDIAASLQLVAVNDNYCFPYSFTCTDFWLTYLAANGKIYISSGNGVIDMHYIDYPDSAGVACGVQQHAIRLPCYSGRTHVNHPNYYLGPVAGSVCDSLGVGIAELEQVRNMKLHPNPVKSGGNIEITYLLPQNKPGVLELMDMTGRKVHAQNLPPWSTIQQVQLPALAPGLYLCSIRSRASQMTVKVVVH